MCVFVVVFWRKREREREREKEREREREKQVIFLGFHIF